MDVRERAEDREEPRASMEVEGCVPAPGDPCADDPEAGMATAEYAIATLAAAAFAGVLLVVLRSGEVREMITSIVRQALSV